MPGTNVNKQYEPISNDVQEILSHRPHWIVRKGNTIFFMAFVLVILITWLIRFPVTVSGPARLLAENTPYLVTARQEGHLIKLLVKNEQQVTKSQAIAYVESDAKHEQVIELHNWIGFVEAALAQEGLKAFHHNPPLPLNELGELQQAFQSFSLESQKQGIRHSLEKFRAALLNLKSPVDAWLQKYILWSPVDGRIIFASFLKEGQWLASYQPLFYVEPPAGQHYAEIMISQKGLAKVKPGQQVLIKPVSYSMEELGYLTGIVSFIPPYATSGDSFSIKVGLPQGLRTNQGRNIILRTNQLATGEIITDNQRLFQRFWGRLLQPGSR